MGLGNGKYDNGNKGSNFNYELLVTQLLQAIVNAVPAAACCPTDATEATLLQVLAAVQNGQEYEQNLVTDLGDPSCPDCPTYLQIRIWNTVTHTFDPPIYYNAAGAVVVPVGPLQLVNPQYVLENILTQLTAINTAVSPVNTVPGFTADTASVAVTAVPTGVKAFSLLFRGTGGQLNGVNVPDGYRIDFGNGKDPVVTTMTYLRPTAGTGMEVLISTLV